MESFGAATVTFVTSMVLARLLSPSDFGLIAVLEIFITTGILLVESGFSSALIRLKDRTLRHEESVLACNLITASALYILIFSAAPFIARFYAQPQLCGITRLLALVLPLNALCVVQQARLSASLRFGTLFAATGIAAVVSSVTAIITAWMGAGPRALVWQQLAMWGTRTLLLWLLQWKQRLVPRLHRKALSELFGFGWKLLAASLANNLCLNLYSMIIGRFFSVSQAGLFSRAQTLAAFPARNGTDALQRVTYPAISRIREDRECVASSVIRMVSLSTWVMLFIMSWLAVMSRSVVVVIFGENWLAAAPYFSLICLGYIFYPVHAINLNILNAYGRSDLFLRLEMIKAPLGLSLAIAGILIAGVPGLCMSFLVDSALCLWINARYSRRYAGVGAGKQIGIICRAIPGAAISVICGGAASIPFEAAWIRLGISFAVASICYMLLSRIMMPGCLKYCAQALRYVYERKQR